jgi:hypothetical protein
MGVRWENRPLADAVAALDPRHPRYRPRNRSRSERLAGASHSSRVGPSTSSSAWCSRATSAAWAIVKKPRSRPSSPVEPSSSWSIGMADLTVVGAVAVVLGLEVDRVHVGGRTRRLCPSTNGGAHCLRGSSHFAPAARVEMAPGGLESPRRSHSTMRLRASGAPAEPAPSQHRPAREPHRGPSRPTRLNLGLNAGPRVK